MSLLLDTHALIWWLTDRSAMAADVIDQIADPDVIVAVSAASVWEIAIKRQLGKLDFGGDMTLEVATEGFEPLPISLDHAERAGALPLHHKDPFDRLLIAQAQAERLAIVSRDVSFDMYEVDVVRC